MESNHYTTIDIEDKYLIPFADKIKISIVRGEGIYVLDEQGKVYLDFTAGWGVTCLGHNHPVITDTIIDQAQQIIQNPNSGLTYSPPRARLLHVMSRVLHENLTKIFFTNSGAEANDAAIKLARKVTGKANIISTQMSFHGRTISTVSATGQEAHRDKFKPLMPNYIYVPFDDVPAIEKVIKDDVAAVILEPIQGEGGVNVPAHDYLEKVSALCREHDILLIMDEIQTGFFRTGPAFASKRANIFVDILTMAKGIAGGFPFGAFAVTDKIASQIEFGDHGGTYCGNPLGCAVSHAVIYYLLKSNIEEHVNQVSEFTFKELFEMQGRYPSVISNIRGKGLLIAVEFKEKEFASKIYEACMENGLLLNLKHGNLIRIFPALTITKGEMETGLEIIEKAIKDNL